MLAFPHGKSEPWRLEDLFPRPQLSRRPLPDLLEGREALSFPAHLRIAGFLTSAEVDAVLRDLRALPGTSAEVYGAAVPIDPRVRSVLRIDVSDSVRALVRSKLDAVRPRLAEHFGAAITSFEEPQFLRYEPGDFFVAHQDGNTPLIHDDSRHRRVSVSIFLNTDYAGGELTLHGKYPDFDKRMTLTAAAGTLVAFPSETTHEVFPVTSGQRYTIVSWYRVTP